MWRGESHFSQKWPLANVGESGEYSVNGLANVGKFGESAQHGLANVGKSGESGKSAQHNLANLSESGESAQHGLANVGESGKSRIFLKTAVLASTRTCQKWRISGEYSNLLNLLASSHCLLFVLVCF
jgi:hypothetical protein